MAKKSQHIVKSSTGGWAVKSSGSSKASKVYNSKEQAIRHGRAIARNQKGEIYIHGKDGKIQSKDSFAPSSSKAPKRKK